MMVKFENTPGKRRQVIATIIVNLVSFLAGVSYGWCATMLPRLLKEDNPIGSEPQTATQNSWLVSIIALGTFIGFPFCSIFSERFGRKTTGLLIALPCTICWLLILFATNFYHLLAAQILNGAGMALGAFFVPLYITEISNDNIRGQLGSFFLFSVKIGLLVSYILGTVLSYHMFALCALIIPIASFAGLLFLPETPIYLIRKQRIDAATKSLMWLRGNDKSAVELELSKLEAFINNKADITKSANIKDLITNRGNRKALIIGIMLGVGQQTCGISILLTHTVTIFKLAQSSVDPYVATIIFGVMQVIGSWLSTITMERVGRRPLLLVSSSGMAICHCILGIFLLIQSLRYDVSAFSWTPVVVLSAFSILYCIGVGPIAHVVPNEVFNPDVASISNVITLVVMTCCGFLALQFFSIAEAAIGLHNCFFLFLIFCICTFFFVLFNVPETSGRSRDSIRKEIEGTTAIREKAPDNIAMEAVVINSSSDDLR